MMGSVAVANPTMYVTDHITTVANGSFVERVPDTASPPMSYLPGDTVTLHIFLSQVEDSMTPVGPGVNSIVASLGFHLEESGDSLTFSNAYVFYGLHEYPSLGWFPLPGFTCPDGWCGTPPCPVSPQPLDPDVNGDEDFGWARFTGQSADVAGQTMYVGRIDVTIGAGADENNSDVQLLPDRHGDWSDTTQTQTLILDDGSMPDDVVINVDFQGLVGVPLVPEPAAMALLVVGAGLIVCRRRG